MSTVLYPLPHVAGRVVQGEPVRTKRPNGGRSRVIPIAAAPVAIGPDLSFLADLVGSRAGAVMSQKPTCLPPCSLTPCSFVLCFRETPVRQALDLRLRACRAYAFARRLVVNSDKVPCWRKCYLLKPGPRSMGIPHTPKPRLRAMRSSAWYSNGASGNATAQPRSRR